VRPLTRVTEIDYRGERSVLGRTTERYAIWDPTVGGPPIREFPLTAEGWTDAWGAFRSMEAAAVDPTAIPPLGLGATAPPGESIRTTTALTTSDRLTAPPGSASLTAQTTTSPIPA
jgi:hypothetical protein